MVLQLKVLLVVGKRKKVKPKITGKKVVEGGTKIKTKKVSKEVVENDIKNTVKKEALKKLLVK